MLPFKFVITGPPVSQQTRRRARRHAWVVELEAAIMSRWPADERPALGPIKVDITHVFHSVAVDLDNLAKPVLDALKGIVFEDDGRVSELTMKKRELNRIACVETPLPLLLDALARGGEFLHVVVEEASAQEVVV